MSLNREAVEQLQQIGGEVHLDELFGADQSDQNHVIPFQLTDGQSGNSGIEIQMSSGRGGLRITGFKGPITRLESWNLDSAGNPIAAAHISHTETVRPDGFNGLHVNIPFVGLKYDDHRGMGMVLPTKCRILGFSGDREVVGLDRDHVKIKRLR